MRAGSLRKYIAIQRPATTQNASGGFDTSWTTVISTWASIEPLSTRERLLAAQAQSEIDHRITVRYCDELASMDSSWRATWNSRVFAFDGVRNVGELNRYIEITAIEGLKQI